LEGWFPFKRTSTPLAKSAVNIGAGPPPWGLKVKPDLAKSLSRILVTREESGPKVRSDLTMIALLLFSRTSFSI
jgi:hypothetical protein